jgi:hypothetical protein
MHCDHRGVVASFANGGIIGGVTVALTPQSFGTHCFARFPLTLLPKRNDAALVGG